MLISHGADVNAKDNVSGYKSVLKVRSCRSKIVTVLALLYQSNVFELYESLFIYLIKQFLRLPILCCS